MAPSATGPVTPNFGLPTLSTGADAPDGIGINNIVTAIDTALLLFVPKSVGTTAGDTIYWSGASTPVRLPIGTTGQALVVSGGLPIWAPVTPGLYRKTSTVQVVNTVADTDLLGGTITVAAGAIGSTGILRLSAWGDWINNTGAARVLPRFKLKLGATTLLDTSAEGVGVWSAGGSRWGWRVTCEIQNLALTNSQWSTMKFDGTAANGVANSAANFAVGEGNLTAFVAAGGVGTMSAMGGGASAVDTTVAQVLAFSVINGFASASYDVTLKGALVEII